MILVLYWEQRAAWQVIYKSLNMSVRRGGDINEGLALPKAAGTYKGEAEVRYPR